MNFYVYYFSRFLGEEERWESTYRELHCDLGLVKTRTLLASAFIVYLSSEQQLTRDLFIKKWMDIQQQWIGDLTVFNFMSILGDDVGYSRWKLPTDITIVENALIVYSLESEVS